MVGEWHYGLHLGLSILQVVQFAFNSDDFTKQLVSAFEKVIHHGMDNGISPEPLTTPTEPAVALTEPGVTQTEPEPSLTEPAVIVTEPAVIVTEPAVVVTEPAVSVTESVVNVIEPNIDDLANLTTEIKQILLQDVSFTFNLPHCTRY